MKPPVQLFTQRGSVLLEAFIAILLFSGGILGLMGLQAVSLNNAADAKYRAEAAYLANQIIGQMWAENPANLPGYAHNATPGQCNFSGGASGNANVVAWIGNSSTPGTVAGSLPGATAARQQIQVVAAANVFTVTVTLCWQRPGENAPRNFVGIAQIN